MIIVSVVVPCKKVTNLVSRDLLPALASQTYRNFELLLITDQEKACQTRFSFVRFCPSWPNLGPAAKRDLGVRLAKGKIIAFIDDDAYPHPDWLKNALTIFFQANVAAVCGPGVTPPTDSLPQKLSGYVWQTAIGAAGAGTYRALPSFPREVDDYPSFNLLVRKTDYQAVGGFNTSYWPGEDTKLCHDLVYKLNKKIVYDPRVLVYHHRRPIFRAHLAQIARYGRQRGNFVKRLPQTSFRLGYFIPSIFLLWLLSFPLLFFDFYYFILVLYLILLFTASLKVFFKEKNCFVWLLFPTTIFLTHIVYGISFLRGLTAKSQSHQLNNIC